MVEDIVSVLHSAWPMALLMLSIAFALIPFLWVREFDRLLLYLALFIVCSTAGMACLSLEAGALYGGGFALMLGMLAAALFWSWWHDKRFPVFDTEPVWRFNDEDGFGRELYIAEIESGFIIGMKYEVEIDDARSQQRTHWKDVFKTWRDAEEELRCRAASYGLKEDTPRRDGGQPPVQGLLR